MSWMLNPYLSNHVIYVCRRTLQRAGKDHTILLVLPSGIYHYKFIVDNDYRYIPDLPSVADDVDGVCNLLDVNVSLKFKFAFLCCQLGLLD